MINISVMVSGSGSNLQALIDGVADGRIMDAQIVLVLSSREDAYALERARRAGIKTVVVSAKDYPDAEEKADAILTALEDAKTDLVVTAGYISLLHKRVCSAYLGRMINIHPSLLPKYGGVGCFGLHVHQAVLDAGDKVSGATVHYVDDIGVDTGAVIVQGCAPVLEGDTAETLQKRILEEVEHQIIVEGTNAVVKKLGVEAAVSMFMPKTGRLM